MLALLPVERVASPAMEPGLQRSSQVGLTPKALGESDFADVDAESAP